MTNDQSLQPNRQSRGLAILKVLWVLLCAFGLFILALTHMGRWLPMGDALAVIRMHILVLFVIGILGLFLVGSRKFLVVVTLSVIGSFVGTMIDWRGTHAPDQWGGGEYTLYQKNLLWNGTSPDLLAQAILASGADFVTLQEVSEHNTAVTEGLRSTYPYKIACSSQGNGGIMIMSRFALSQSEAGCRVADGLILAQADLSDGTQLWIGSIHLNWPYPFDQARQLPGIFSALEALDAPVVIGGDFNMVPWGSAVRRIIRAADGARVGGYWTTYPGFGWLVPLAIDHVVIPKSAMGRLLVEPLWGSDHYGLLLRFRLTN